MIAELTYGKAQRRVGPQVAKLLYEAVYMPFPLANLDGSSDPDI